MKCQICTKKATLRCPTCVSKHLPDAHYCSQTCFKQSWPIHKLVHLQTDTFNPYPEHRYTGPLRPHYPLSAKRILPATIEKPDYADDPNGHPYSEMQIRGSSIIAVLTDEEIEKMRVVCRLGREVLEIGKAMVAEGVTTDEIDEAVHQACVERDAYPSPLNYYNFPKSCCTSVNEVICHGIY